MEIKTCAVCGATSEEKIVKRVGALNCYLCSKHKAQFYRNGKITDPTKRTVTDRNEIRICDDHAEIILRNRNQELTGIALIDLEDVDKCKNIKWYTGKDGYVRGGQDKHRLHRYVLNYEGDLDVDHINRNTMDNRKANLRIVPRALNAQNNGSIGVSYVKETNKWRSYFQRYGNYYHVGIFDTMEEAIKARQDKIEEVDKEREALLAQYAFKKGTPDKGVRPSPHGKWIADFWADNIKHHVGTFNTKQEAIEARKLALDNYFREKTSA